ncbi:hypothetical protein RDI58_015296 [Solanum bulbocastanum]|uniref:Uncharacterized protein n=1 Tax=Solanum bulbocastanum TaxID=147425 RepID=A0AAN8TN24_SOLBU
MLLNGQNSLFFSFFTCFSCFLSLCFQLLLLFSL